MPSLKTARIACVNDEPVAQFDEQDLFRALYADWLRVRADQSDPLNTRDDAKMHELCDREQDLWRRIMATPAPVPWMTFMKLDVLEYYVGEDAEWTDNREISLLGSIKADLRRFLSEIEMPKSGG